MSNRIITIGSGADCDIRIDDLDVAAKHGILYLDGNMICFELMPGCMAYLNDNQVEGRYWLQDTDTVVVGTVRLNIVLIRSVLTEGRDIKGLQLYVPIESLDDLNDAVSVKRNWWPVIIITLIILAIVAFAGNRIVKYQQIRKYQEKELRAKQDSLMRSQSMIDSLTNKIKKFEIETEVK